MCTSTIDCSQDMMVWKPVNMQQYYTSNSNCPIRKLSLCHVSMKLIAISRLTSSFSEPAFLLTMFHPMFPGEHGVEHYSRRPRGTTRMTTRWPTKRKKVCVKFLILNLEAFNFRYNISFIDPPLGGFGEILPSVMIFPSGQSPSGSIITSCNISPNPPRSRSINDKSTKVRK